MADLKYGRLFTMSDVEAIITAAFPASQTDIDVERIIDGLDHTGMRFKFPVDEPTFTLRARDQRAIGALVYYRDHQANSAPANHLDGIQNSVKAFDKFRFERREQMKEPD